MKTQVVYTPRQMADARRILADLVEWDAYMGGHEDHSWKEARMLLGRMRRTEDKANQGPSTSGTRDK